MTGKSAIAARLGERGLLLPSLIGEALQANDRIKLRFSLLQEALAQARNPHERPATFAAERQSAGLGEAQFDAIVSGAKAIDAGAILAPGAGALIAGIKPDLAAMLAPVEAADPTAAASFSARLERLGASLAGPDGDAVSADKISAMTSGRREAGDSLHLLVMDLHKAINAIAAASAPETIDGASAHGATPQDRVRIAAFMRGVNRTRALAFGHPGLGTTAVRTGASLTIQNDIGTTDAHVLVVHVEGQSVAVTYTDVHRIRAKFFIGLFAGQDVEFSPLTEHESRGVGEEDVFYLLTGRFSGAEPALLGFLEALGARLVFLIDWNKARKALQIFTGKEAAAELLAFAARHEFGHRAFLELGGADLVFDSVRKVAEGRIPYGARLDDALGRMATRDFLREVLRRSSLGLSAGRSARLIRDEIQADLSQRFQSAEATLLELVVRHLGLSRMLAGWVADMTSGGAADWRRLAARSALLEKKADALTVSAREIAGRLSGADRLLRLVNAVENAMDSLDECAFLISLRPEKEAAGAAEAELSTLAGIGLESFSHLIRASEAAMLAPAGQRADATDALRSIDAVLDAEHRADAALREAMRACFGAASLDARGLTLRLEVARMIEASTDHLAHAALALRDHVLKELSA
ncbi:conserved hypothetical protein [Methylocella silvestris BL2]|uniref:Phosphate transport regulator n=1 Tax=Methylocella silvestris (strain DSM 15510 / CIP 108128 / LMG 27833 / NCIMB 13906 / BL2) TaxID=395965 RepID=B8EI80_METSB|nr:hypothetical protein [Methylocella silvestris]ACK50562.1 conserved hypothetical protein [Methylocella silvestris BL2]